MKAIRCPWCGANHPADFYSDDWLDELEMLAIRYDSEGFYQDLQHMTRCELWGLYLHLKRK